MSHDAYASGPTIQRRFVSVYITYIYRESDQNHINDTCNVTRKSA